MPSAIDITFADEPLTLLHERAVLHSPSSTLFLSDLHLGKPASYRALAAPVPESVTDADLARLSSLLAQHRPERLCVLGDLFHDSHYTSPETLSRLLAWRAAHSALQISLILGNHDRRAGAPLPDLRIDTLEAPHPFPPFTLLHDPADARRDHCSLAGHIHPAARLSPLPRFGPSSLRAPCFWLSEHLLVLPAFSRFTGSALVSPRARDRIFPIHDNAILEVATLDAIPRPRSRARS